KQEKVEPTKQEQASLSEQIRAVRKIINKIDTPNLTSTEMNTNTEKHLANIEATHINIFQMLYDLKRRVEQLESNQQSTSGKPIESQPAATNTDDDDDNDIDLFGSDDEEQSEETKKCLVDYTAKKANKENVIAKSTIVLDVKPWDDETDLEAMEKAVRSVEADGLVWGQSKLVPVAYGVKKLQIGCVVEDDKVGTDFLEEKLCGFEDYVQSVDIVIFNKAQ
ncbi:unnamed protein product, partial [Rotaria sp. Silwood1]